MGQMSVRFGSFRGQGRSIYLQISESQNAGPHTAEETRTRLHRIDLARPDAIQSPFLFPPQHATETPYRLCGNRDVQRRSSRSPPLHRRTLFLVQRPIIVLTGLTRRRVSISTTNIRSAAFKARNAPHYNTTQSCISYSA